VEDVILFKFEDNSACFRQSLLRGSHSVHMKSHRNSCVMKEEEEELESEVQTLTLFSSLHRPITA